MTLAGWAGSGPLRAVCLLWALVAAPPAQAADSLRCGSRIVSVEAILPAVLAACGEPAYRDVWRYYDDSYARYVGDTEVWTYNFGPNQLLRILRFRDGRLNAIETDGYGFRAPGNGRCAPTAIIGGLSKYRLVSACGEPATKRALGYLVPDRRRGFDRDGGELSRGFRLQPSYREEWTYNFGARYLLRRVMLENGRVVDVEDGERGYDAP
ncbi:MAG: hypothetical protein NVS9B10_19700 [Nevskia sp.]